MDLRSAILEEHSRSQVIRITKWIGNDTHKLKQLMHLFMNDEYRVVQRAAWIISSVADNHPDLVTDYISGMIGRMKDKGTAVAVKRNVLRILQRHTIPPAVHGELMNLCFEYLADPKETIAVRAFSMGILERLSHTYPEIRNELKITIETELALSPSPGFRSKAKKVIKSIS